MISSGCIHIPTWIQKNMLSLAMRIDIGHSKPTSSEVPIIANTEEIPLKPLEVVRGEVTHFITELTYMTCLARGSSWDGKEGQSRCRRRRLRMGGARSTTAIASDIGGVELAAPAIGDLLLGGLKTGEELTRWHRFIVP
jgi:hypothetical protein